MHTNPPSRFPWRGGGYVALNEYKETHNWTEMRVLATFLHSIVRPTFGNDVITLSFATIGVSDIINVWYGTPSSVYPEVVLLLYISMFIKAATKV